MFEPLVVHHNSKSYATIIIPLALPTNYTWEIPSTFSVQIGMRVEVELRKKKYAGIVKQLTTEIPNQLNPKPILNVLDEEPLVHPTQLKFWEWLASYYMCTEGEVMQAAIPSNLKLSSESILVFNAEAEDLLHKPNLLSNDEFIVAEALLIKQELKMSEVQQLLDTHHVITVVKKLVEKRIAYLFEDLQEKYKPKTDTFILLHPSYKSEEALSKLMNEWGKAPKQLDLLLAYLHFSKTEGQVTQSALLKKANASQSQLKGLIDKGILVAQKKQIDRIEKYLQPTTTKIELSNLQQKAINEIEACFALKNVCLLHGITASGKTHVYIQLLKNCLQHTNRQALFLLPEIALTSQIIRKLQNYFGNDIVIYHSKFNPNERVEIWNKVKTGEAKIVLGARSALFLPFKHLQLIIVDEEHETSYKQQDPAPRYHARDAAIFYAQLFNANVLLGSATPSIETYYNCLQNKFGLVQLNQRFSNMELPKIELVDLKPYLDSKKSKIILSPPLKEALHQTLHQGKQAIVFQNRRGYSPYTQCTVCGWIPQCNNCSVTLTFHKSKNQLSCHYCSTTYPLLQTCLHCGSSSFVNKNFGTEQLEEVLATEFPQAKIARMDWDTVRGKQQHETIIKQFEQQKIDILVGTQMVVKGLDFEHVNLVGIADADGLLNFADFRVNERAFQLMEQVSGRAGRKDGKGKVMIQVSNMHHPTLAFVKEHDYQKMYAFELEGRRAYHYPPFTRIIYVQVKHTEKDKALAAANIIAKALKEIKNIEVNGPSQPPIDRVRNKYLWDIQIKLPKNNKINLLCKQTLRQQIIILKNYDSFKSVGVVIDVDGV